MTDNVIELVVNNKRPDDKDDPANWPKWKKEIAMSLGYPERIFEENVTAYKEVY